MEKCAHVRDLTGTIDRARDVTNVRDFSDMSELLSRSGRFGDDISNMSVFRRLGSPYGDGFDRP